MRRILTLALVPALMLTAACGDDTDVETGSDQTPTDDTAAPPDTDATEVAISIEVGGGFVPYGFDFAAVPTVIHDDGTAFTGGMITAIFPGPALSPVLTGTIDADELATLLDAAEQVGLASDSELDGGQPNVTDMPTTTIKVRADGEVFSHSVYGLEFGSEIPSDGEGMGLTEKQIEVRRAVSGFVEDVNEAVGSVASEPYVAEAYDLLPQPLADAGGTDPEVQPNKLDWPFSQPILEDGSCMHLDGEDAANFTDLLDEATQITEWTDPSNGAKYRITARAVIPGFERDC